MTATPDGPTALDTAVIYTGTVYMRLVYTPADYTAPDCTEVGRTEVDTRPGCTSGWTQPERHDSEDREKTEEQRADVCCRPCLINLA